MPHFPERGNDLREQFRDITRRRDWVARVRRLRRASLPLKDEWLQRGRRPVVAQLFWRTHSRTTMLSLRRKRSEISLTNNADRAFEAGQWRRAADLYRRVLDRNPDNLSIWMKYGHSRKEMGNFGEAESAYRAAAARNTSSPEPRLHLGHILKMQGRQQEAEAAYLQVIGLHASNPEALSGLESLGWSERQLTALRHIAEPAGGTPRE